MRRKGWMGVLAGCLLALGFVAAGQSVDLSGPTQMGRCEEETFTVRFTADLSQTASAIVVTSTRPNAGFAYVPGSGLITLHEGTPLSADPGEIGLNLVWDLDLVLGTPYALPAGETVTLEFALATGCGTVSGTLGARVDYYVEDGSPRYATDSQPIEILPGAILVYKEPAVVEAAVGDLVTWTLVVENTGLGPIYNVVVTDVLGSGLAYVGATPPGDPVGQTITWEIPEIRAGERVEIELRAQVIACTGLENRVDARFGCNDGSVCFDTAVQGGTATASIRLLLGQPLLEFDPPEIRVPYCSPAGATVTIPVRNVGDGSARDIRICADYTPFTVANVAPPASYDGSCFHIPDLAPNETFSIQFDLVYFGDWCTPPGRRDVFYYPVYRNDCGEEFRPPVGFYEACFTCYGPEGPPTLVLSLTGEAEVHICQDVAYLVTAGFSGLSSCGGGTQSEVTVVVNVPDGFAVVERGGGDWVPGPGDTGGTITWTFPPESPLETKIALRPPGARQCGAVATLSATASATDCCGCPLSVSQAIPIAIECRTLVGSTKVASPPAQEKCGRITYTNTYTFADSALLDEVSFDELTFVESATNLQAYVPGSLVITVDGNPASPLILVDTTPGGTLEIRGIDYPGSVRNTVLVISYTLEITPASHPQACPGSYGFYTWSTLTLGPDCRNEDECAQYCTKAEAEWVMTETPAMAVGLTGLPDLVDPCETYTITLTLTKTSTYDPHDVVLQLGNLNYYIVDLGSIVCSGDVTPTNCTAPIDMGTYYEWTYGEAFVGLPAGARSVLTFQVKKRCGPGVDLTATARYRDACGGACSGSATDTPLLLRRPNLFVYKTPDVHYATTNTLTWTIYVVNSGAGWAYDVWVDDLLGSGLEYVSSSVAPATGVTTTLGYDHLGNPINGVSWRIAAMSPGEQRVITLVTRLVSCTDLTNQVWASLGCGGEDCLPPVSDSSYVLIPTTQLTATSSTASPIAICATQPARISIRNAGDPAVYNLVVRETLPPGLRYVPGTTRWRKSGGPWLPGSDPTIDGDTLEWTELEVGGLAELRSRWTLEIEFDVQALCDFTGGDLRVSVGYVNVCGQPGTLPVGTFHINVRRPSLAVEKNQISPPGNGPVDCGGEITWRIDVTNTGQIPVPYVWVEDELGSGFVYVSSTGGVYGVDAGCRSGSTVTWALRNLPPGATAQLTLTAWETGCGELRNFVGVWWGCGQDDGSSCTLDAECLAETYVYRDVGASRTPNVAVSASLNPTQIPACGTTTMTLEIRNPSSATASALDVRVRLPAGLSYVPGTTEIDCGTGFIPRLDPEELGGYLYWYDPVDPAVNLCAEVPPGGTVRLRFGVQASCYRTTGNAAVQVYFYDCCLISQQEFDASYPLHPAVPTLTITKLPATVPLDCYDPGSTVTWQIRVQNTGAASADWVRVEDTLGTNLVYVGSSPAATEMGGQRWGWEFGPLLAGESRTLEITVRLSQPSNDCASALRTNTAQAWWGCGSFDGDPRTVEGCTGGGPVTATARATIPDLNLGSTDILPILTCVSDGNYTGRVQITIRNLGDAPVTRDFRLTITESTSGWSVSGLFAADFGGTLPIAAGGTRTITVPNWPVTCGQCSYSFTVTLDTEDALCECRENNNAATRAWTITLPDLTVRDQGIALTCTGDGQVRISGTVTLGNEGCGSPLTANVPLRFTLYSRAGCGGTVLHQWTQTLTGVNIPAKGQQVFTIAPQTINLNACGTAEGCTLSLLIEADHTNSICECDGANNTRCVDLPVNIPDLTVARDTLGLTCAGDGLVRISGTVTLGNEGCGGALTANVPMRFTLRSGSGCAGTVLYSWTGTFTGVNIPAGGEQTFNVDHTFALNLCTVAGCTVSLLIEADHANSICECNGTNNTRCVNFALDIPDLVVTSDALSVTCAGDGQVRVSGTITVANQGCGSPLVVDIPVRFTLRRGVGCTGAVIDQWTEVLTGVTIPAGGSQVFTITDRLIPTNICTAATGCTVSLLIEADHTGSICECNGTNNTRCVNFALDIPDLAVTSDALSVTCAGDGEVRVSGTITVANQGCGSLLTADIPVRFTLRSGAGCTGAVIDQWTEVLTGVTIPAGGSQVFAIADRLIPTNICTAATGCTVSLLVEADHTGSVCECNGTNNTRCVDLPVNIPDLTVRREALALTCAGDGQVRISGTVTLGNEGCGGALTANVPMRFTLRSGSGCAGTVLYTWTGTFTGVNIPAGGEQTFNVDHTFALNLCAVPGCTVSLLIEADHTGSICECNGTNNTLCVDLPVDIPDLAVVEVVPDVRNACARGTVDVTVENVGCVAAPAGIVVRITGDATGRILLPALQPGESATVTVPLDEVLPCGSYAITATVDPDDGLCECAAANNALGAEFNVVDPDLTLTDLSVQCRGDGSFNAAATVRNTGTEASPATTVRIYVDGGLFQTVTIPGLPIGGAYPVTYVTPRIKCGADHLFRLVVDEEDQICECNAGNNAMEALARCGCPALVTRKSITQVLRAGIPVPTNAPVEPGDLVTYTLTVTNVGSGWAFNVDLWDELPVEFAYVAGSTSASWPGGSSTADPAGAPGPSLAWDLSATLLPAETLTLQFQALVTSLARQGFSYTNTMGATGEEGDGTPIPPDSRLPGDDDPDDRSSVRHPAAVPALALDKAITDILRGGIGRGPAGPVEPGDVIIYTVTIRNVGFGVAYDVDFTDVLPPGVEYETAHGDGTYTVDNPAASGSLGIPDGVTGLVTADISATIAAGGTLVATYRVRVLSTVSQGVPLINSAAATGEDGAGTPIPEFNPDVPDTYPDRDFTRIPVVEPGLALDKEIVDVLRGGVSIWPTPIVLWGDVIVYRVTVRNVGLGTAYDVDLADELPFGLAYDTSGDGTYTVDNPAASGSLGIPDGTTGTIYANISATIAGGGTLVAVYRARVLPEALPGQYLVNRARVTGKDGVGTPIPEFNPDVADTYLDEDTTRILLGVPALVTKKEVFCEACPCDPAPAPCDPCAMEPVPVKVGERVTFRLTVANVGHSRAYDVVVHERLPEGLVYVGETTRVVWPGGESEADPVGTPGPLLTWVTGASLDAGESLTVTFGARVAEGAPLGEALNTMWATGVDAFAQPIPADSSTYVPADNDPDDLSTLRLQVGPPLGGSTPRGTAGGWLLGGMGALLAGVAALRFRLARSWLVLLLGLLAVGATAVGSPYTITVRTEPPKAGVIFGAGVYPAGETVRLTALPNRGFELVGWFEDGVELSTLPLLEFPADRHRTLVAKFRPILELVGLSGLWDGSLTLLPTPALGRNRFEVRPRFVFGPAPWDLRIVALFTGASWTDAQGHFTGAWEAFRFGGGLVFNPAIPAYRSGYLAVSWPWGDLRLGLRVSHYPLSGTPPAPYLLYDLSLGLADLLLSVRAEERGGLEFRDLTVQLLKVELCCGIQAQGLMSFTKAGFSSARVSVMDLPWVCCGLSWDFTVAFTPGAKAVEVAPRWDPYCDACLTLYGDVVWDELTSTWGGLALYGYKIRCCWGGCCPQTRAPAGYIEFLTAFDPSRVPGGFRGDEFEYIKVGACGPGCCGEGYTFEGTAYFAPTGLFGLSRFRITAGIPLGRGFVVTPTLEISGTGAALELSWRFRF